MNTRSRKKDTLTLSRALRKISISQAYVILLISIAILVTGTHFVTTRIMGVNKDFAAVINISGRQRMLSQRMMLYAHEATEDKTKEAHDLLKAATEEFTENHADLIDGNPSKGLPTLQNEKVRQIYFGESALDRDVNKYIIAAKHILGDSQNTTNPAQLKAMHEVLSRGLLDKLDTVVLEHQKEAERILRITLSFGTALWLLALLTLALEARYLFYPITKRVESEIRLRRIAENELTRSNKELEDFAYVASHDLKAPLRHIAGCADIFEKDFLKDVPEEAQDLFRHITGETKHMRLLIDSLLEFSRVGQHTDDLEAEVDLAALADRVIRRLNQIDAKPVKIVYENLPTVRGNELLLERLFDNLIGNSIKYVASDTMPEIRISAEKTHTHTILSFADNGIGIPAEYSDRIFRLFQRLHGKNSGYEGVGLGLAIVKRIVELHGGAIELDTDYSGGARFLVTLPLA
ncbi:MAG: ATP-binding protein [Pseudobdellovibrionaceae bacterium]